MYKAPETSNLKDLSPKGKGKPRYPAQKWVTVGDQKFFGRSKWERNFGRYLEWKRVKGLEVVIWRHEPKTFWFKKIKRGACSYKPDFEVIDVYGHRLYYEVKGWLSPRDKTKLKRMKKYYPAETVVVKDAAWFKQNNPMLSGVVPGWE